MQNYPHIYKVCSQGTASGNVELTSVGLETLQTAPPAEFGGPGDVWSPETLFAGAVADCYVLSFRAVATIKKFEWIDLKCETEAVLEKVDRVTRFTRINMRAKLTLAEGSDLKMAESMLKRAKDICLVTNSMTAQKTLEFEIVQV